MIQSFDLQSARAVLSQPDLCPCPHHGTGKCSCQYMVWLIRGSCGPPLSLAVHGHDDCTYITISNERDDRTNEETEMLVRSVIDKLSVPIDQHSR